MRIAGLLFDFNGTLSDDEGVLYEVYAEMFASHGRTLERSEYFDTLAGHTDAEIFRRGLGVQSGMERLIRERVQRYLRRVGGGGTINVDARGALLYAASHVPVGIVTSARREEVEPVLRATRLDTALTCLVCAEDVTSTKPDPEPYLVGTARLGVAPEQTLAVEDSEVGIAAAAAAGLRVVAVRGTTQPARLRAAERILDGLTADEVSRLLS